MAEYHTVSEVARLCDVRPRDISDLFYQRHLSDTVCPVIGGRRLIPTDYLHCIQSTLSSMRQRKGRGLRRA